MRSVRFSLFFLLALVLLPATPVPHETPSATFATSDSAMRVFLDPETGRLRAPTAEERREFARQRARVALEEAPVHIEHRDGMRFVHLPPERDVHLSAEIGPEGNVRLVHDGGRHE